MNRIKSALAAILGTIIALAAFGLFASVGLALIGGLFTIGAVAALIIGVQSLFARKDDVVDHKATEAPAAA